MTKVTGNVVSSGHSADIVNNELFSHQAIGGMTNDTSVDVSLNTTAGTDTSVAEDNASDSGEEEEEEDDEDRGRARFKSERSSAVKPASKLRVKQDIPDTLGENVLMSS